MRAALLVALFPLLVAAGKRPPPTDFPVVIPNASGTVEAHFDGVKPSAGTRAALARGTTRLFFTFQGDKTALVYEPEGTMLPQSWSFELFSPDGTRVLFVVDHAGPLHVVETAKLREYLRGEWEPATGIAAPEHAKGGEPLTIQDFRWKSNDTVEWKVAGEKKPRTLKLTAGAK